MARPGRDNNKRNQNLLKKSIFCLILFFFSLSDIMLLRVSIFCVDYCLPFAANVWAAREFKPHRLKDGVSSNQRFFIVSDEIYLENHCNLNQFSFLCCFCRCVRVCVWFVLHVVSIWQCYFGTHWPNPKASICYAHFLEHLFSCFMLFFSTNHHM